MLLAAVALLVGLLALAAAASQPESNGDFRQTASRRCSSAQVGPIRARDCRRPAGPRGPRGLPGPKGNVGAVGPQGPTGLTGPQGAQGFLGLQGIKGDKGDKGETGAQGPQGNDGTNGTNGTNGAPGAPGGAGPQGPAGPSTAFAASADTSIGGDPGTVVIVSKTVPASSYAINAKLSAYSGFGKDAQFVCNLRAQGIGSIDFSRIDLNSANGSLALQAVLSNYGGGTIDVACTEGGPSNIASTTSAKLTAIQVGSIQ